MATEAKHQERRTAVRLEYPCQARLHGGRGAESFDVTSVAENVGSGGLYMRSPQPLDVGTKVFGVVTLPTGAAIAGRGHVRRLERRDAAMWGVAVQFSKARLVRWRTHQATDAGWE